LRELAVPADKKNMKSIALTVTLLIASLGAVSAQQPSQTASLAEVARTEEARRKTTRKATKVFTNSTLSPTATDGVTSANATTPNAGTSTPATRTGGASRTDDDDDDQAPAAAAGPKKDQKYWAERIGQARAELDRAKIFAESLQTRINSLTADIVNLDYPARGAAEQQRNTAVAELERLKKDIDAKTKGIAAIEDEARRANVPSGWLRP
jgi:hypothetical protein